MNWNRIWVNRWVALLFSAAVWVSGCSCAGSLQPLESGEPLMESASLRGKWVTTDANTQEQEYFLVDNATTDIYFVSSLKPNGTLRDLYEVSLVQVGSYTFLDAKFAEIARGQEHRDTHDMRVLPIHFIGKVWIKGDTLRMGLLNYDWLEKMISGGKVKLPYMEHHEENERFLLLTAESDKLTEFVRQFAEDPDAFSTVVTFHRVGPFERPRADSSP